MEAIYKKTRFLYDSSMKYKVILPVEAESINEMLNFSSKIADLTKFKRKWEELALFYIKEAIDNEELPQTLIKYGSGSEKKRIIAKTVIYFRVMRERDESNYSLIHKALEDALLLMGVIPDDSSRFVKFGGIELYKDDEAPRIEFLIDVLHEVES